MKVRNLADLIFSLFSGPYHIHSVFKAIMILFEFLYLIGSAFLSAGLIYCHESKSNKTEYDHKMFYPIHPPYYIIIIETTLYDGVAIRN